MSSMMSALDELESEDLRHRSDEELEGDFAELERAARVLQAEQARRLAEIQRRETWRRDGYVSTIAWLGHRFRTSFGVAMRRVREAAGLEDMPATREALKEGELSPCAVRVLVSAREAHPEEFARDESTLLDAARTLSARGLRRALAYWRQALDGPKALEDASWQHARRRLYVSPSLDGMVRVDGDLDPETGQTLITALRAVQDAEAHASPVADQRSSAQCRADALGEICRQWLDNASRPDVGGERPHVTVTVSLDALEGRSGRPSEFDDVGPVHPEIVRRWACDASISRIITRGQSEPLDVGRRTAVVPAALRRAVVVRDEHCRFPGCDRPASWCDAHHVVHWADGAVTALANLVLLCRRHHRLVHDRFGVRMVEGRPEFTRPDGTQLPERAPP
jgi:Domain of unknown function (DUF222)